MAADRRGPSGTIIPIASSPKSVDGCLVASPQCPLALQRDAALAYAGVSSGWFDTWVEAGLLAFRPFGPNDALVCLRSQLEQLLERAFAHPESKLAHGIGTGPLSLINRSESGEKRGRCPFSPVLGRAQRVRRAGQQMIANS